MNYKISFYLSKFCIQFSLPPFSQLLEARGIKILFLNLYNTLGLAGVIKLG